MSTGKRDPERFQGKVAQFKQKKKQRAKGKRQRMARVGRLDSIPAVAVYLARIIKRVERQELDLGKAYRLGLLCRILCGTLQIGDLEPRLRALEMQANILQEPSDGTFEPVFSAEIGGNGHGNPG